MKTYKLVDFITGNTLLIACVASACWFQNERFIYGYFITGGWQLVSMFIHLSLPGHYIQTQARKIYEKILLWLLVLGLISLALAAVAPFFLIYLYLLLFVSPLLAVYYQVLSHFEYRLMVRKAFIHLKN